MPLNSSSGEVYQTEIHIYGNNRTGLLVDVSKVFTERDIDIKSIFSKTSKRAFDDRGQFWNQEQERIA